MKKYKVIGYATILHNSKKFLPGEIIELEDSEAMRLRLYLEPVPDKKSKASDKDKDKAEQTSQSGPEQSESQDEIFNSKTKEQNKE